MRRLSPLILVFALVGCPGPDTDPPPSTLWPAEQVDLAGTGVQPVAVAVADIDGDGDLDVVSAWRGNPQARVPIPGTIALHLHTGPGTWQTVVIDSGSKYSQVNAVAIGDINRDQRPDVVVAAQDRLFYLRAPATPAVAADWRSLEIAASVGPSFKAWYDVAIAQIDGNEGPDLVATLADDGRLVWFQAPATPDAETPAERAWVLKDIDKTTRKQADSLAVADLNGDGRLDVISSAPGESTNGISWYEQPADLAKNTWTKHPMSSFAGATRLAAGDLDGDGKIDVAAVSPADQRVAWLAQPARVTDRWGGFVLARLDLGSDTRLPIDVAIADVDGNGRNDVIVAVSDPGGLAWFTPGTNIQNRWIEEVLATFSEINTGLFGVGDVDGDGDPDVIVPADHTRFDARDHVYWLANPYTPTTQPATQTAP
jgi:hypothetical protein